MKKTGKELEQTSLIPFNYKNNKGIWGHTRRMSFQETASLGHNLGHSLGHFCTKLVKTLDILRLSLGHYLGHFCTKLVKTVDITGLSLGHYIGENRSFVPFSTFPQISTN